MDYVELALVLVGVAALIVGYRRNRRGMLVAAALILFVGGTIGDFTSGLIAGYRSGPSAATGAVQTSQTR